MAAIRPRTRLLATTALAVLATLATAASPWVKLSCLFVKRDAGASLSFYPVKVPAVRLSVAVSKEQVEAYGTSGRIAIDSVADLVAA